MKNHYQENDNMALHFNDKALHDQPLFAVFKLAEAVDVELAIERTRAFCLQTTSDYNKRVGLEYLYGYGFLDDLEKLIDINLATNNRINHQWAHLYQIICERRMKRLKAEQYMSKLSLLTFDSMELKCLRDFLHVYSSYDLRQFNQLGNYLDSLLDGIHQTEDPMLRELFSIRMDEILMTYHWKRSEMIIARKHGYRILATTKSNRKKIDIHSNMALGYLFDDYDQAMFHALQAEQLADLIQFTPALEWINSFTIPFISSYHGKTEGISTTDPAEQAHIALARGDAETCIQILSNFEQLSPFQQYYLGKAKQDINLLQTSYNQFVHDRSDYFFAKLPLKEMDNIEKKQKRLQF